MTDKQLYRFLILIIIFAIIKLVVMGDYDNAIVLVVGLIPLLQDIRTSQADESDDR